MRPRLILLLLLLVVASCSTPVAEDATGEEIFIAVCARCHGVGASGDGIGPALGEGSEAAGKSDEALILTVTRGRARMPSFESRLSAQQIERVVAYLRSIQTGE